MDTQRNEPSIADTEAGAEHQAAPRPELDERLQALEARQCVSEKLWEIQTQKHAAMIHAVAEQADAHLAALECLLGFLVSRHPEVSDALAESVRTGELKSVNAKAAGVLEHFWSRLEIARERLQAAERTPEGVPIH